MSKKYIKPSVEITITSTQETVLCSSWWRPRKESEYELEDENPWSLLTDDEEDEFD